MSDGVSEKKLGRGHTHVCAEGTWPPRGGKRLAAANLHELRMSSVELFLLHSVRWASEDLSISVEQCIWSFLEAVLPTLWLRTRTSTREVDTRALPGSATKTPRST